MADGEASLSSGAAGGGASAVEGRPRRHRVGYALAPKKQQSFIQPSLLSLASSAGVDLVSIDAASPLSSQGPFDCIIHKLYGDDWRAQLESFAAANPGVPIVDSPSAIERLHNRISMLQVVSELDVSDTVSHGGSETFGIPSQVVVYDAAALTDTRVLSAPQFPLIAKPLVADGSAKSHKMSLVYNTEGLRKLKPPLVLQEFVNHGGVIFKVYVVGDSVTCVKRRSLPDVSTDSLERNTEGSVSFSQVSNLTAKQPGGPSDVGSDDYYERLGDAAMPPERFVTQVGHALRRALGLQLFNFDMIRDVQVGSRYLIIDINYFPGYAKMPNYENVLTNFFVEMVQKKDKGSSGTNAS